MNNISKRLVIRVLLLTLLIGFGIFMLTLAFEYFSWKTIRFNLSSETRSISIYSEKNYGLISTGTSINEDGKLDESGEVRLKAGLYYIIPEGENISDRAIKVDVNDKTVNVEVAPFYSDDYLANKFSTEISEINQTIQKSYGGIMDDYQIDDGFFYHYGDWYSTSIWKREDSTQIPDLYGVIVHKVNNNWSVVSYPQIVFRYNENKDVPTDIIDSTNQNTAGF